MKTDVRRIVEDCAICENEKGKRNLAHGLFSSNTTTKPRSRYSMDFQGQGLASTGETDALALIDSFTKTARHSDSPNQPPNHHALTSPDIIHSDDAPEFLSDLMTAVSAITGTARTTTRGHNPQSNGEIESWWRYWNRAMRYHSLPIAVSPLASLCPTHRLCLQLCAPRVHWQPLAFRNGLRLSRYVSIRPTRPRPHLPRPGGPPQP
jgi:hypothetical protein